MYSRSKAGVLWSCALLLFLNFGISRCHDFADRSDYMDRREEDDVQAQLSYIQSQLRAVAERVVSLDHRFNALDHRITALDQRVNSLDPRLGVPGELGELKMPSPGMNDGEQSDQEVNLDDSDIDQLKMMGGVEVPFRLTWLSRQDRGLVHIVTARYQSSVVPDILLKVTAFPALVSNQGRGVATVYIPKREEGSPEPSLFFLFPDYFLSLRLRLDSPSLEMDLPRVTLKIAQGNDVIFRPGSDAQLSFAFYLDEGHAQGVEREAAVMQFLSKSEEEENTVDRFHFLSLGKSRYVARHLRLDLVNMKGSKGNWNGDLTFSSSGADAEGILEAFVLLDFNCSVNCLVKRMTQQYHVNVFREDHQGPFPDGFIGFVRDDFQRNESHVRCDVGPQARPCSILCEAAGGVVTSVEVQKGDGSGWDSSRIKHLTAGKGGYWGTAMMAFEKLRMEDSGDYWCVARSGKKEIRKRMTLVVEEGDEDY